MPEWTASQLHVINSDAREIICSAAAGSGKTAVMVERIVRFLREGADPSAFLVVTFTNAAAAEMREKIRKRMQEEKRNEMIRGALDQMDAMQISTIHAFCQQLLRNQFQDAGIDPNFQICDPTMTAKLFHEAFTDACGACAAENGPLYDLLRARYEPRQAEKIIQSMYSFLMSLPDPFGWLERQIDSIPDHSDEAHPWFAALRSMALEQLHLAEVQLARMYDLLSDSCALASFHQTWQADYELFHVKQTEIETNAAEKKKASFARMKQERNLTPQEADWRDRYREIREEYKKRINRIDELLMTDPEECLFEWKNMRESLVGLRMLLMKTQEIFTQRKRARNLMDFQDLEQETVRILSGEQTREEVRNRWRYLFVDECQDISDVQNHIIDLLSSPENHLFMVGDVKQSIYRFRLADPTIFLNRIRKCRESGYPDRECIYLQSNFRSRPEILEVTNRVFRTLMKESVTEIGYGPEEELIPGRKTEGSEPVRVEKIQKQGGQQGNLEAEADYLVEELKNLLQEDYPEKGRKYQYRDCVILMPAVHTDGPILAEMLEKRNVPVFFDGTGDYYQLREIQIIRNLLEWIDHPLQDLPLLSVLQEEPFSFTEEELARIRLKYPDPDLPFCEAFRRCAEENTDFGEKCGAVERKLREWQGWAETRHVAELIWDLYHDTGIYYILGVEPTGEAMQANLRMLAQQAEDAESRGILTLRDFLAYMKDQQLYGDQQAATLLGEQDNLVRIMTIHKSKGLQFPVVFCAGMDKQPLGKDTAGVRCHAELGVCVNYKDPEHRISRPTLAEDIFVWKKKREETAEKIRLLYVAMTRAQEKLYLLTCQDVNPLWSMPEGEGRILSAKTFTDWWMPVFTQEEKNADFSTTCSQPSKPYEIRDLEIKQHQVVENDGDFHSMVSWLESVISAPVVDEMWKREGEHPDPPVLKKRSVTSLIRSARKELEEDTEEETAERKRMPDQLVRNLKRDEPEEIPAFMRGETKPTGAWRGTITHRILSMMDLDRLRRGEDPGEVLAAEKERMIRNHMATEKELKPVDDGQIVRFWKSEMGKRILSAAEVHREWNFNLLIERDQHMILQGVIDCAFREGEEWVILDYKTDRGKTAEELAEEYRPQLLWYSRAVSQLTGQRVREAGLYALSLDCLVPVLRTDP